MIDVYFIRPSLQNHVDSPSLRWDERQEQRGTYGEDVITLYIRTEKPEESQMLYLKDIVFFVCVFLSIAIDFQKVCIYLS